MHSLTVHRIAALQDNYIWLPVCNGKAVCIDPSESEPVSAFLRRQRIELEQIWITHEHHDHIGGIDALKQAFPQCTVYAADNIPAADQTVNEGSRIVWQNHTIEVWHTPGHTAQHLSYLLYGNGTQHLFCGDTLFSAGCGRVFSGSISGLYRSLQRIVGLPENTLLYPAHEYTASNLRFAAHVEPDNGNITEAQAALHLPSLPVTLAHEKRINPFLRTRSPTVRQQAQKWAQHTLSGEEEIFAALREWKNRF